MAIDLFTVEGAADACDVIDRIHREMGVFDILTPFRNRGLQTSLIQLVTDHNNQTAWASAFIGPDLCFFFDGIATYQEGALLVSDFLLGKVIVSERGDSPYVVGLAQGAVTQYLRMVGPLGTIRIAGHSMGGAVADWFAHWLAAREYPRIQLLTLAAPRYATQRQPRRENLDRRRLFFADDPIAGSVPHPEESPAIVLPFGPFSAFMASLATHTFQGWVMQPNAMLARADSPWDMVPGPRIPGGTEADLIRALLNFSHAVSRYRDWFRAQESQPAEPFATPQGEFVQQVIAPYRPDPSAIEASAYATLANTSTFVVDKLVQRIRLIVKGGIDVQVLGTVIKATAVKTGRDGNFAWACSVMGLYIVYGPRKSSVSGAARAWNKLMRSFLNQAATVDQTGLLNAVGQATQIASTPAGGTRPEMQLLNV